jgi:hypothetical protein
MDPTTFYTKLLDNALTLVAMAIAVWWLQKTLAQFIGRWDQERAARLDAMDKELQRQREDIARQRERNDECERDRLAIHRELFQLFKSNPQLKSEKQ